MSVPNITALEEELREIVINFYKHYKGNPTSVFMVGHTTGKVTLAEQILRDYFDVDTEELR